MHQKCPRTAFSWNARPAFGWNGWPESVEYAAIRLNATAHELAERRWVQNDLNPEIRSCHFLPELLSLAGVPT